MTVWDFIYITGCALAWCISIYGFTLVNKDLPEKDQAPLFYVFAFSAILSFLSWGLVIFVVVIEWDWKKLQRGKK